MRGHLVSVEKFLTFCEKWKLIFLHWKFYEYFTSHIVNQLLLCVSYCSAITPVICAAHIYISFTFSFFFLIYKQNVFRLFCWSDCLRVHPSFLLHFFLSHFKWKSLFCLFFCSTVSLSLIASSNHSIKSYHSKHFSAGDQITQIMSVCLAYLQCSSQKPKIWRNCWKFSVMFSP